MRAAIQGRTIMYVLTPFPPLPNPPPTHLRYYKKLVSKSQTWHHNVDQDQTLDTRVFTIMQINDILSLSFGLTATLLAIIAIFFTRRQTIASRDLEMGILNSTPHDADAQLVPLVDSPSPVSTPQVHQALGDVFEAVSRILHNYRYNHRQ
ncbi:hypothetical protein B0O99DRAFT_693000 [Bisporella sp. PMI_857]|nr:hypothetical protein B0O99DRAFT_693000 [Bisporella sp. PMI_857]